MADLIVIYDSQQEVAAIVDTTNRIGVGPAHVGEDAQSLLTAWMETIPYDVSEVNSVTLRDWFEQFAARFLHDRAESESAPSSGPPPATESAPAPAEKLADATAAASGAEPPAPAPHDQDPTAQGGPTPIASGEGGSNAGPEQTSGEPAPPPISGPCPACSATGIVPGPNNTTVQCNLCHGTGQLPVAAPA